MKAEKIYKLLPPRLQNFAFSVWGHYSYPLRYGSAYRSQLAKIGSQANLSLSELEEIQLREVNAVISAANRDTSHYRDNPLPKCLYALSDLTSIPVMQKSELRANVSALQSAGLRPWSYRHGFTSGTSGSPMRYPVSWTMQQRLMAFREVQYAMGGCSYTEKSGRFSGRVVANDSSLDLKPYRFNSSESQTFFSSYHISPRHLPAYIEELAHPDRYAYLDGFPSALFALASLLLESGAAVSPLKAVFTTAEPLYGHQREVIEKAFQCKVFNYYSSSEGAPFVVECRAGGFHLIPESGYIEIVRSDGSPAAIGEVGDMLVTSFYQDGLALIRYAIGDRAAKLEGPCPCGSNYPLFTPVEGRIDDVLITKERGQIGRLDPVFKTLGSNINEAQIAQVGSEVFEIRYNLVAGAREADLSEVVSELKDRVGSKCVVRCVHVPSFERGKGGKFKAVVNEHLHA